MSLQIISGTAVHEFVDDRDSAAEALGQVLALIKAGMRNIRVLTEEGRSLRLVELEELAEDEADSRICSPA